MTLAAAVRPLRCSNPDCTLPQGGRCARLAEFKDPLADCPDLGRAEGTATSEEAQPTAPWSGRALIPSEVGNLLERTPARLIAVVGPYDAGKTCLLTSFFLQLANGQRGTFPYRFASSLTLHAFSELTERADAWSGHPAENVVDHTTKGEDDAPRSFLHIGLRPTAHRDDRHVDVLLSDLPGEWFKEWSKHLDPVAEKRLGFVRRCDAFIVLADAGALLGEKGNQVDSDTSWLVRRIAETTRGLTPRPPLALVFSKFDRILGEGVPPALTEDRTRRDTWGRLGQKASRTWLALEEARRESLPFDIFPVSAFPFRMKDGQPVGVMEPFTRLMTQVDAREPYRPLPIRIRDHARGFAAMRRWREP